MEEVKMQMLDHALLPHGTNYTKWYGYTWATQTAVDLIVLNLPFLPLNHSTFLPLNSLVAVK